MKHDKKTTNLEKQVRQAIQAAIEMADTDAKIFNLHVEVNIIPDPKDELHIGQCTKISKEEMAKQFAEQYGAVKGRITNGTPCSESTKNTHPLKNPDSTHYAMWRDSVTNEEVEAIDLLEKMATKAELLAWAKISLLYYRLRIGKKDDIAKEMTKIKTYEAYIEQLEKQIY